MTGDIRRRLRTESVQTRTYQVKTASSVRPEAAVSEWPRTPGSVCPGCSSGPTAPSPGENPGAARPPEHPLWSGTGPPSDWPRGRHPHHTSEEPENTHKHCAFKCEFVGRSAICSCTGTNQVVCFGLELGLKRSCVTIMVRPIVFTQQKILYDISGLSNNGNWTGIEHVFSVTIAPLLFDRLAF